MTATTTTAAAILKRLYPQRSIQSALYKNGPLLGQIPKSTKFVGADMRIAIRIAPTSGRSRVFATAQSNVGGVVYSGFDLTRVRDYSIMRIQTELLEAAATDEGALVRGLKSEMDGTINAFARSLCRSIYRNGGGAMARVGSVGGAGNTVLTLLNREDIVHFELNQRIVSDDTDGTSGAADAEVITIIGVDRNAGTLTAAGSWIAGGNFANNDYLFAQSDFGLSCSGLAAWLPPSAPSATSFFGVDRTVDSQRLGGVRFAADSDEHGTIENALIQCAAELDVAGGSPEKVFMNSLDFAQFTRELGDKRVYCTGTARTERGSMASVGYKGIEIAAPGGGSGTIEVYADRDCPRHRAYMLQMDTWILKSLNELPHWLMDDGAGQILRVGDADSYEGRLGGFYQIGCEAPGWNATIDLSALTAA